MSLLANALALVVASMFLTGFAITGFGFVVAVCIFTAATVLLEPLITRIAAKNAPYLLGGIALVTTLVGLVITTLFTDGLHIIGVSTWIMATLIIWIAAIVASLVLRRYLFKDAPETTGKAEE
jgi:uncharacterized membrane protein YvlD (DUF360 family)